MTIIGGGLTMLRGFWAILKNEMVRILRDPASCLVSAIPLAALLLFGYAMDADVKSVPTVVLDFNHDAESRQLVKEFGNTGYFKLVGEVPSDQALQDAIVSGRARVGIKIPTDYSTRLLSGGQGQVQVIIDGSDATTAAQILNSSQQLGFLKSLEREGLSPAMFSVDVRPHVLFNPNLRSANFIVPGLIGILLQLWTLCLTPIATTLEVGRLRERQGLTPASTVGRIGAILLAYNVMGLVLTLLMLVMMVFLFDVPIAGSAPLLLCLSVLFLLPALCVGLIISLCARNQSQATQLALIMMLASVLLSGFMFPLASMPPVIYGISKLIPLTHYLEILRGVILRGTGIAALWDEALALAGLAGVLVLVSTLCFKKHSDWPQAESEATNRPSARR
jgi:ABC-type multidrug transport system permease subunit